MRSAPSAKREAAGEDHAHLPADMFDAGENLIISAYSRSRVQEELGRLVQLGSRVISEISAVGDKWVASCERPRVATLSKVEHLGNTRIVTGPTREAVTAKVERLVGQGTVLVADVECINGVWTAVCYQHESS